MLHYIMNMTWFSISTAIENIAPSERDNIVGGIADDVLTSGKEVYNRILCLDQLLEHDAMLRDTPFFRNGLFKRVIGIPLEHRLWVWKNRHQIIGEDDTTLEEWLISGFGHAVGLLDLDYLVLVNGLLVCNPRNKLAKEDACDKHKNHAELEEAIMCKITSEIMRFLGVNSDDATKARQMAVLEFLDAKGYIYRISNSLLLACLVPGNLDMFLWLLDRCHRNCKTLLASHIAQAKRAKKH